AGDEHDAWRESARRRLAAVGDEKRLSAAQAAAGPLRLAAAESPNFRIQYDERLGEARADYARTVARYLEDARAHALARLGVAPAEPTGVIFYGKAAYLAAHKHRFSFPTVGFYDGRIHVASAAHPAGELRALLFHEYVHAVFAERTGGHRPFWLNEGLAELAERASSGQEPLTRRERAVLRERIASGEWIPLADLAAGFGGLPEGAARLAYLEATAAAAWVTARATPERIAALLDRLGAGESPDAALRATVGADTAAIDAGVRAEVEADFPRQARTRSRSRPPARLAGGDRARDQVRQPQRLGQVGLAARRRHQRGGARRVGAGARDPRPALDPEGGRAGVHEREPLLEPGGAQRVREPVVGRIAPVHDQHRQPERVGERRHVDHAQPGDRDAADHDGGEPLREPQLADPAREEGGGV